jgi:hypothetical protein
MKKESGEYTLYGDLDGKTVKQLKELLDLYPEDAVLDARSSWDPLREDVEYFVFKWETP